MLTFSKNQNMRKHTKYKHKNGMSILYGSPFILILIQIMLILVFNLIVIYVNRIR